MDDISVIEYKNIDLSNSMLVVAFPTVGLISSIAGHFIIDSLKLQPIGSITSSQFMPVTVIHKSIPSPPVRIYAGKKKCGPNDTCNTIAIIISEFMPSPEIIKPLVDKIFGIATTPEMKKILKNFKISQTQEGMITGVTGVLLYQGMLEKRDVLCLLAETQTKYPDSRAAAALLEKLDKMLPAIKIDPKPLYESAKQIEDKILQSIDQSKPTAPSIRPAPYSMYR